MPVVFVPPPLRSLTAGQSQVTVTGTTLVEVIEQLEASYPGLRQRLCEEGRLKPEIQVAINQTMGIRDLRRSLDEGDEIHFLPAIGGG